MWPSVNLLGHGKQLLVGFRKEIFAIIHVFNKSTQPATTWISVTGRLINSFDVCTGLHCDMAVMQHARTTWNMCLFWWQHFTLSCRLSIDKKTLSRPSHQRFFVTPQILGGTWPDPTRVSLLSLWGAGRERPWERGWPVAVFCVECTI